MCECLGCGTHWAGLSLAPTPAGLRGVGGRAAESLVPMETAGFRMLLAPVLVQMGWELGVGSLPGGGSACST